MRRCIGFLGTAFALTMAVGPFAAPSDVNAPVPTQPHVPPEQRERAPRQAPVDTNPEGRGAARRRKREERKNHG